MNPDQFHREIIRPVLAAMGMGWPAAERLMLGTAMAESNLEWLRQIGGGPALGVYQMEPATFRDILSNYVGHKVALRTQVERWSIGEPDPEQMVGNLYLATVMARLHYRRRPEPLPDAGDAMGMARYWKQHYNTALGKGDPAKAVLHFERAIKLVAA